MKYQGRHTVRERKSVSRKNGRNTVIRCKRVPKKKS